MNDPDVALAQKAGWLLVWCLCGAVGTAAAVLVDRLLGGRRAR